MPATVTSASSADSTRPAIAAPPPLVLTSDEAFAMPLATTMRSLVDAHPDHCLEFHVLFNGITARTRDRVMRSLPSDRASIRWVNVEVDDYAGFPAWERATRMNYTRFLIPSVFPSSTGRVLFLDSDLLVLDRLDALWNADLDGAMVGAVRDQIVDPMLKSGTLPADSVPRVRDYFNAGVMLIDLPRWRAERICERALAYLAAKPRSFFADQDALNSVCDGRWKELPATWNYQRHRDRAIASIPPPERPRIVHFVTNVKPWNPAKCSANAAFFDEFRRRTAFARTRRERANDAVISAWTRTKRWIETSVTGPALWATLRKAARTLAGRPLD